MEHFSSLGRWAGSWVQLWPKTGQNQRKTKICYPPYWPQKAPTLSSRDRSLTPGATQRRSRPDPRPRREGGGGMGEDTLCHAIALPGLREAKMINPASGFWTILGPPGPPGGPGSSGNGPGSKKSAGCTKDQPGRPILSPIRGHFVFLGPTAKR